MHPVISRTVYTFYGIISTKVPQLWHRLLICEKEMKFGVHMYGQLERHTYQVFKSPVRSIIVQWCFNNSNTTPAITSLYSDSFWFGFGQFIKYSSRWRAHPAYSVLIHTIHKHVNLLKNGVIWSKEQWKLWKRIGVMVCKKSAYLNCSGALTNCSGRLITVPEDL